jgi:hypothetical protein
MKMKFCTLCLIMASACAFGTTAAVSASTAKPASATATASKTAKPVAKTESKTLSLARGSTLMFNIQKLSNLYGWDAIIQGADDIEIMRDTSIKMTGYKSTLATLIKGYPIHIDLYEANHVAVISILSN